MEEDDERSLPRSTAADADENVALEERLSALERRKPKEPLILRLWHTLTIGLVGTSGVVYAYGWVYDNLPSTGTKLSIYLTLGIAGLVSVITSVCSLGALDNRRGLRSPWRAD